MSRWQTKRALREHPAVIQRRTRASVLAMISDPAQRERYLANNPESSLMALPKKRTLRKPSAVNIDAVHKGRDIEAPVVAAVSDLLRVHPRVLFAVRQNSGALPYDRGGKPIPVHFYKLLRKPADLTIVDFSGFLTTGEPFALECKRPLWIEPRTEHEMRQLAFLDMIRRLGGVASFVRSVDEAQRVLA